MLNVEIGERLIKLRETRGISKKQLCEELNVHRNAVSRWESGASGIDATDVARIADYFGVSCDFILRGYTAENVQLGQDTGLSNETLELLKQWHRNRPDYDNFSEYLLSGENYWNLNRCVRNCVDIEKYLVLNPNAVADDVLIGGTADNWQDKADFMKYKAVQCFQRILDSYIERMVDDGNNNA